MDNVHWDKGLNGQCPLGQGLVEFDLQSTPVNPYNFVKRISFDSRLSNNVNISIFYFVYSYWFNFIRNIQY